MSPMDMTEVINGERYFTVKSFAIATNRSEQSVRFLMSYGNRLRKLKVEYKMGKPLIPYSELTEFPFTLPGRNSEEVYHYDAVGNIVTEGVHDVKVQSN